MLNTMILQGRMVADPELKNTPNGTSVTSFRVAWSQKYKDSESRLFLPCVAWRGTAEFICRNFVKGQEIVISGNLTTREYTDRDGNNRQTTELVCSDVHFCGPKAAGNNSNQNNTQQHREPNFADLTNDDGELPF